MDKAELCVSLVGVVTCKVVGRCLRPALSAYTTQALIAGPVSLPAAGRRCYR